MAIFTMCRVPTCFVFRIACIFLTGALLGAGALAEPDKPLNVTAEDILLGHYDTIRATHDLEFTSEFLWSWPIQPDKPVVKEITKYQIKEDYLRTDRTQWLTPDAEPDRIVQAYDGEKYQIFRPDSQRKGLSVFSKISRTYDFCWAQFPALALPYDYAIPEKETDMKRLLVYAELNRKETWDKLIAHTRVLGTATHNNMACTVIEVEMNDIKNPRKPVIRKVYCANDLQYYPLYWEEFRYIESLKDFCKARSVEATKLIRSVESTDSPVFFPQKAREVFYTCDVEKNIRDMEVWVFESTIDPGTVRINSGLDDSVFTIPPSEAGAYIDQDTHYKDLEKKFRKKLEKGRAPY